MAPADLAGLRAVDSRNGPGTVRALTGVVLAGRVTGTVATRAPGACRDRMRVLAVVAVLIASSVAAAQPNALGLAWQAPAACPTEASVRARIEQRLGEALDDAVVSGIDI